MALLFMDGFDHYAAGDVLQKWTSGTINSLQTGRLAGSCVRFAVNGTLVRGVAFGGTTIYAGLALRVSAVSASTNLNFVMVGESGLYHAGLCVNSNGSISAVRGGASFATVGAVLGTSAAGLVSANVWVHVQVKITVHDTAGTVDVWINGNATPALSLTSQDTRNAGTGTPTTFAIGAPISGATTADVDDVYVGDTTGSAPWNTVLGDCRIDARAPTGAGATTGWTPSTGSNWQNVDDATPNGDTDYNSTTTVPATDTFVTQDSAVAGATIYGVQQVFSSKKSDAGTASLAHVARHSGTDYVGADVSPSTSYAMGLRMLATNPGTSAQWTESDFNAAEFGYKRTV